VPAVAAEAAVFVVGAKNPIVVVVVAADGTVIVGALDIFVVIGNAVAEIGAARRLESVLLADEVEAAVVVATGRKLFAAEANDVVVAAAAVTGLNEKGVVDVAFVAVVVAIFVAGGTNAKAGFAVLEVTGAAVYDGSENDGPG
jgi:hypothetical protein